MDTTQQKNWYWTALLVSAVCVLTMVFVLPRVATTELPVWLSSATLNIYADPLSHATVLLLVFSAACTNSQSAMHTLFLLVIALVLVVSNSTWFLLALLLGVVLLAHKQSKKDHLLLLLVGWLLFALACLLLQTDTLTLTSSVVATMRATSPETTAQYLLLFGIACLQLGCGQLSAVAPQATRLITLVLWYLWLRTWPAVYGLAEASDTAMAIAFVFLFFACLNTNAVSRSYHAFTTLILLAMWLQTYPAMLAGLILMGLQTLWVSLIAAGNIGKKFVLAMFISLVLLFVSLAHLLVPSLVNQATSTLLIAIVCFALACMQLLPFGMLFVSPKKSIAPTKRSVSQLLLLLVLCALALAVLVPHLLLPLMNDILLSSLTVNQPARLALDASHIILGASPSVWGMFFVTVALLVLGSVRDWWSAFAIAWARVWRRLCQLAVISCAFFRFAPQHALGYLAAVCALLSALFLFTHSSLYLPHLAFFVTMPVASTSIAFLFMFLVAAAVALFALQRASCATVDNSQYPHIAYFSVALFALWLLLVSSSLVSFVLLMMVCATLTRRQESEILPVVHTLIAAPIVLLCTLGAGAVAMTMSSWFSYVQSPATNMNLLLIARVWDITLLVFIVLVTLTLAQQRTQMQAAS